MYILDVIPLTKLPLQSPQILSYFSSENLPTGSQVLIKIRGREVGAIVKDSHSVQSKKLEIKNKDFSLKGIEKIISPTPVISKQEFKLASWFSNYYLCSLSSALQLFIPRSLMKRKTGINERFEGFTPKEEKTQPTLVWQDQRDKRYVQGIKKTLKEEKQALLLVPEIIDVKRKLEVLKKEFSSDQIVNYHSRLNTSEQLNKWKEIRSNQKKIIVGTRSAVFTPCHNLGLLIVDQEADSSYKSWHQHPRYHTKNVAKKLAEMTGSKIMLGSSLPSVGSYYQFQQDNYELEKKDQKEQTNIEIADLKKEEEGYTLIGAKLKDKLEKRLKKDKKSILFINRRGAATSVICQDCGHTLKCDQCEVPLVYHQSEGYLLCHHCGSKKKDIQTCPNCGSHKLKYFGSGTQKVAEEIEKIFSDVKLLRLDSDIASTSKEQQKIINEFKEKGKILIGTRLLLKADFSDINLFTGVVLIDPILSLPQFDAQEQVFRMISSFKNKSEKMIIQTYNSEHDLFNYLNKKPEKFFQEELKNRETLWYPPYSSIIKLNFKHSSDKKAKKEAEKLKVKISDTISDSCKYKIMGPVPNFVPRVANKYIWNLIIKSDPDNKQLKKELKKLIPKNWEVDVDPIQVL